MSKPSRWNIRVNNNCLFIDDVLSSRVVLQHNARPGLRPYIHPLRLKDGRSCLTEDSPWHHPWQHGISTGFHGVNNCDFWLDPGQHPSMVIGTIEPKTPKILSMDPPKWSIEATWYHANGSELLAEQQTWSLQEDNDYLFLDLDWALQAIPDIHVAQDEYGGLFIRMPFRSKINTKVLNSTGLQDAATEQQAAEWLSLHMPLENNEFGGGITVLDHPENPQHPAKWRVDHQRGVNPAPCIPSAIDLPAGAVLNHRYRLILHEEKLAAEQINNLWAIYKNS
jgi:hypothetical protein